MIKWIIIITVIAALAFLQWGCSSSNNNTPRNALHIEFNNTMGRTLWVDIVPGNSRIEPFFSSLDAGQSISVQVVPDIFDSTTAGFNFYESPAKMSKKAIIIVRDYQVFVRQCPDCKVTQPDRLHAQVFLNQ